MVSMADIAAPANLFYAADVGSSNAAGAPFAGWYIVPGYGNSATDVRWAQGQRHAEGRVWIFADGHAKWLKDPSYRNGDGTYKSSAQLINEYRLRGIYTDYQWDSNQ